MSRRRDKDENGECGRTWFLSGRVSLTPQVRWTTVFYSPPRCETPHPPLCSAHHNRDQAHVFALPLTLRNNPCFFFSVLGTLSRGEMPWVMQQSATIFFFFFSLFHSNKLADLWPCPFMYQSRAERSGSCAATRFHISKHKSTNHMAAQPLRKTNEVVLPTGSPLSCCHRRSVLEKPVIEDHLEQFWYCLQSIHVLTSLTLNTFSGLASSGRFCYLQAAHCWAVKKADSSTEFTSGISLKYAQLNYATQSITSWKKKRRFVARTTMAAALTTSSSTRS